MNREVHVPFCERLRGRFPRSTHLTAIPELIKLLNLQGCLVTIDAMGCQKKIATQVLQKGADYLLSVKEKQPALAEAFEAAFPMTKVANFEGDAYVTPPISSRRSRGGGSGFLGGSHLVSAGIYL